MDTEQAIQAVVDRFESKLAVLVTDDGRELVCSKTLLPKSAAEGDVVRVSTTIDRRQTQARAREVRRIIDGA